MNVISPSTNSDKKVCERKAISCQSTPLFGRHNKHTRSESEGKKVLTFQQKETPKSIVMCEKKVDVAKSQTIVIAPTSSTITTTLAKQSSAATVLETVHGSNNVNKKGQKLSKKLRDVSLEYEITYDDNGGGDANQSSHGFISSFNQLTSHKQSSAIICANLKRQSPPHVLRDQQQEDLITQHDTHGDDGECSKNRDIEIELNELGVIDGSRIRKKKKSKTLEFFLESYLN